MPAANIRLLCKSWLEIGAMGILSLLCFIWAGQTSLGFYLLTCTFIFLINSGFGGKSNEFQPCSITCSLVARSNSKLHSTIKTN
jgi:superfamily I DNA and RNA helicase